MKYIYYLAINLFALAEDNKVFVMRRVAEMALFAFIGGERDSQMWALAYMTVKFESRQFLADAGRVRER